MCGGRRPAGSGGRGARGWRCRRGPRRRHHPLGLCERGRTPEVAHVDAAVVHVARELLPVRRHGLVGAQVVERARDDGLVQVLDDEAHLGLVPRAHLRVQLRRVLGEDVRRSGAGAGSGGRGDARIGGATVSAALPLAVAPSAAAAAAAAALLSSCCATASAAARRDALT